MSIETGHFSDISNNFEKLTRRKELSRNNLSKIEKELNSLLPKVEGSDNFCCFSAGSIARKDCGERSDLDIFLLSESPTSTLDTYQILGSIITANNNLNFPKMSNDGQFLSIHSLNDMEKALGHPTDDYNNLFTTRMLLILESAPVYNKKLYERLLSKVIKLYFRDKDNDDENQNFIPIFILNDILRYWRTMCLNYEKIRTDESKPWRKKNINLKFSRMLSVYGTVIPIAHGLASTPEEWISLCQKTPIERLCHTLDQIDDKSLTNSFEEFLSLYSDFLDWKDREDRDIDRFIALEKNKATIRSNSEKYSEFMYKLISHKNVDDKMKKVLSI